MFLFSSGKSSNGENGSVSAVFWSPATSFKWASRKVSSSTLASSERTLEPSSRSCCDRSGLLPFSIDQTSQNIHESALIMWIVTWAISDLAEIPQWDHHGKLLSAGDSFRFDGALRRLVVHPAVWLCLALSASTFERRINRRAPARIYWWFRTLTTQAHETSFSTIDRLRLVSCLAKEVFLRSKR